MRQPNPCLALFILALIQASVTSQPNRYQKHFSFRSMELQPGDPSVWFKINKSNPENIDISKLAMSFYLRLSDQTINSLNPFMAIFLEGLKVIQLHIESGITQHSFISALQLNILKLKPVISYRNWKYYDFEISYNTLNSSNQFEIRNDSGNIYSLGDFFSDPESIEIHFGTIDSSLDAKSQV